jgi:hypothetical protein
MNEQTPERVATRTKTSNPNAMVETRKQQGKKIKREEPRKDEDEEVA